MPSKASQFGDRVGPLQPLGFDPGDVDLGVVRQAAVQQRFFQALVGILVLDVFADQADGNLARGMLHAAHHFASSGSDRADRRVERQQAQRDLVDALLGEHQRAFVDALDIDAR